MSVTGAKGIGIPVILLHDAEGGQIHVELKNGDSYRGLLDEAQDNMNMTLKNSLKTKVTGEQSNVETVYIRGSQITFISLPEMLAKGPMFNRIRVLREGGGHTMVGGQSANQGMNEGMEFGGSGAGRGGGRGRGGFGRGGGGGRFDGGE